MKICLGGKAVSVIAFTIGAIGSSISGGDYWQGIVAGSLFGIWLLFLNSE